MKTTQLLILLLLVLLGALVAGFTHLNPAIGGAVGLALGAAWVDASSSCRGGSGE